MVLDVKLKFVSLGPSLDMQIFTEDKFAKFLKDHPDRTVVIKGLVISAK